MVTKTPITRKTTAAEAFALAGKSLPKGARLFVPINGNPWKYISKNDDCFYFTNRLIATEIEPVREDYSWLFGPYSYHVEEITINNLPAVDAWNTLPAAVREKLEVVG